MISAQFDSIDSKIYFLYRFKIKFSGSIFYFIIIIKF